MRRSILLPDGFRTDTGEINVTKSSLELLLTAGFESEGTGLISSRFGSTIDVGGGIGLGRFFLSERFTTTALVECVEFRQ